MSEGLSTAAMTRAARTSFSLSTVGVVVSLLVFSTQNLRAASEVDFNQAVRASDVPGLAEIDHIDTIRTRLPQVWLHVDLQVLGPEMCLGCEKHLNVLGCGVEYRRKVCGSHSG